jgi:hypothetical protein
MDAFDFTRKVGELAERNEYHTCPSYRTGKSDGVSGRHIKSATANEWFHHGGPNRSADIEIPAIGRRSQ